MENEGLRSGIILFIALIASLSVHEAAHAFAAFLLGDPTAKREGRLTINPLAHLDQLGTVMIALMAFSGMGLGWAKPVPVNPLNFRNRKRDMGLVAFAGPFSNLLQAILAYWLLLLIKDPESLGAVVGVDILTRLVQVNIGLAAFNLLPVYPLDGQKVLSSLLPSRASQRFDIFCVSWGAWPLLIVIVWEWALPGIPGPLRLVMGPIYNALVWLLELSGHWLA